VLFDAESFARLDSARDRLSPIVAEGRALKFERVIAEPGRRDQRQRLLARETPPVLGVLDGTLSAPRFVGAGQADGYTVRQLAAFIDAARQNEVIRGTPLAVTLADSSSASVAAARAITARAGQAMLFVLTILLAGMLLSQLIEEKSSKVIEVLSSAVPIDSIFLGKLFAMLAMSLIGIVVWLGAGAAALGLWTDGGLAALPPPAVGWPAFLALGVLYFATSYLLIGAAFLGVGAQASTVREVQTLSMPLTMIQVVLFGFATSTVGKSDTAQGIGAAIFPLTSPFAMLGRAAEQEALWPHLAALAWQALWVALILHVAARMFRWSVLNSGPVRRWPWQRRAGS
jgi:ABC-2 type transport system permease protein